MPRLAESILELLEHHGVDTVFGIPGNHNVELYRYLPDHSIRHVTARHEQGAGFMADGYARASGRPGVCFVISGPGVTNVMTAMAQALADSVPLLVIATVGDQAIREGRLHELPDQLSLAKGVSLDAIQPDTADAALSWIDQAMTAHLHRRPGPRFIQIPLAMWEQESELAVPVEGEAAVLDPTELTRASNLLDEAVRPLILIGGGAQHAAPEVVAFASLLAAPVVNTVNAKGVMPPAHALAVGGSPSLPGVRRLMEEADVIVAVGTELGETDYDLLMTHPIKWQAPILRIDIDAQQAVMNAVPTATVIGDSATALKALQANLVATQGGGYEPRECWADLASLRTQLAAYEHMHPQFAAVFESIDRACPDAVVVGDSTRPTYYASWMWERPAPRRYWHSLSGYGTLGYALGAAIGAQFANLQQPVIALIGDGGLMFTLSELAVAVQQKLPIKVILWDNAGYQEIARSMAARDIDIASTQYSSPDFSAIARGFGALVSEPENCTELEEALAQSINGPHLIRMHENLFITQPAGEWY
jgi:acetolactate synthase-1/2/3 large subunit